MKKMLVGLIVALLLMGSVGLAGEPETLKWALIPAEEPALEIEMWKPIGKYLEEEIGIPIELKISTDYTAVVQAIKFGHADMARFGPFNYVLATQQTEVEALVRSIKKSTGKDAYYSLIITHRYSDVKSLEDLREGTFAFVDPASCSGSLVPKTALTKAGIDPEKDLKRAYYAGSHQGVILAVKNKKVDAGAVADNRLLDAIEKGALKESEVVIIFRSELICNSPVAVRKDMDENLKKKLKEAFITMPKELALNYGCKALGWVEAKDEDYDIIREISKTLEL